VLKVFISSRIKNDELKKERSLARRTIEELNLEPVMWELLPPSMPKPVEQAYLDGVRLSQLYVGIIGAMNSPGSLEEFQEATKLGKPRFMFVKNAPNREPRAAEFLREARKLKCGEYSEPVEFSSKLETSLLDFMAEQTLSHLETISRTREDFVRDYIREYVRPLLDEVKEIENALNDREFASLLADAWVAVSRGVFFGTDSGLDQRVGEFYSKVHSLNNSRAAALEEHRENVTSVLQSAFQESARGLNEYNAIERLLTERFDFFLTNHEDYYELAGPLLDQLDGPVRSIGVEHRRIPGVSAIWLVDNVFKKRMLGPYFERNRMPGYVEAFDTLLTEARRTRELLLRIYQGNASIGGN
jgi:hypothetical protein